MGATHMPLSKVRIIRVEVLPVDPEWWQYKVFVNRKLRERGMAKSKFMAAYFAGKDSFKYISGFHRVGIP